VEIVDQRVIALIILTLIVLVAIGWGLTKLLYMKAAGPAPARF